MIHNRPCQRLLCRDGPIDQGHCSFQRCPLTAPDVLSAITWDPQGTGDETGNCVILANPSVREKKTAYKI